MMQEECVYFCGPYQGYHGKATLEDGLFHGEVMGVQDVVTFQGKNPKELRKAFCDSVDDYLKFCAERGEEPSKPYSGKFLTRMPPELHRELSERAEREGKSMNQYVVELLQALVKSSRALPRILEAPPKPSKSKKTPKKRQRA